MGSTANNNSCGGSPSASSRALSGTPIAREVPVTATGARPGETASGKRGLFKEATTTALIFPNGGVIRLSVAVAPGQLLFLSNPQNQHEVVAQVTRRRDNPAAGYYVELEFTEAAPDFWGVAFAENPQDVAATADQSAAAELMRSSGANAYDLGPDAPAPSAQEVQALMEEVKVLRAQLKIHANAERRRDSRCECRGANQKSSADYSDGAGAGIRVYEFESVASGNT